MKWPKTALLFFSIFFSSLAQSHHYKGLPHYSYFENYPQVPYLEFIKETPFYEVFLTVYNFQGLNLDQVESPDDVRFYLYIYDIKADKVYKNTAKFEIFSNGNSIFKTGTMPSEQENIFIIQQKITERENLDLRVEVTGPTGEIKQITVPFKIEKSFLEKYGVALSISIFFLFVILLRLWTTRNQKGSAKAHPKGTRLVTNEL